MQAARFNEGGEAGGVAAAAAAAAVTTYLAADELRHVEPSRLRAAASPTAPAAAPPARLVD